MDREYNGWLIRTQGGFSMVKHYVARKGDLYHWAFLLRDCKAFCDARDNGGDIGELYLKPLYV